MNARKSISKVNTASSSNNKKNLTPVPVPTPVAVVQPPLLPTPTLPNGEPVPPGITIEEKKPSNWLETNHVFLYNEAHLYGTYRIHLKDFIDYCQNGCIGPFSMPFDQGCDIKVYPYKADASKKFVTVNVRANDTFRMVKMFEPMSSEFLKALHDQCVAVYQNLVNMLGEENVHKSIVLPLSVVGIMKDDLYEGRKTSAIFPKCFSIQIKSQNDAVYRYTVLAFIDYKIGELSQLNQH